MGKIIELESHESIPEYTGFKNIETIETREGCNWYGHAYGFQVGIIYDNGTVDSYFKKDSENGNTDLFDRLRNDIRLIKKHVHLVDRNTGEEKSGNRYFIPYKVKDHCSDKPTITDCYVDRCSNVHYSVEYEILLVAGDGLKRYITDEYETKGCFSSCLFDQIENMENMFEEWFEEGSYGFKTIEDDDYDDDYKTVTFYDETGNNYDIEISSIRELMSMIASIRVIKCDREIIEEMR